MWFARKVEMVLLAPHTWALLAHPCLCTPPKLKSSWIVHIYLKSMTALYTVHCSSQQTLFVIVLFVLPDFSNPLKKSLLKCGHCSLVQFPTGGVSVCRFLSGHGRWFEKEEKGVWDFKHCGRGRGELPVCAVWSFDNNVSKRSQHIRLNSVWCQKPAKSEVSERWTLELFSQTHI